MKHLIKIFLLLFLSTTTIYSMDHDYSLSRENPNNLIGNIKELMHYTNQRHNVLSENIANANVPKAQAKDLENFQHAKRSAHRLKMYITSSKHLKPNYHSSRYKVQKDKEADVLTPNGNNIDLFQQSTKMEENTYSMKKANKLYKQFSKLRKAAAGDRTE
jgi:flagellar basal-body rod protein FlgB